MESLIWPIIYNFWRSSLCTHWPFCAKLQLQVFLCHATHKSLSVNRWNFHWFISLFSLSQPSDRLEWQLFAYSWFFPVSSSDVVKKRRVLPTPTSWPPRRWLQVVIAIKNDSSWMENMNICGNQFLQLKSVANTTRTPENWALRNNFPL